MKREYINKTDNELYDLLFSDKRTAEAAFEEIYNRNSTKIYTYCKRILNDGVLAEDIFQETFSKFYQSLEKGKPMTNLNGYLLRIARNLCLNEKEKKCHKGVTLEEFKFPINDNTYENKELKDIINAAIDALQDNYREVIILKEQMDLSYKEIAEIMNTPLSVIRIRIFRAKNKLKEILAPFYAEYKNNI